MKSTGDLDSILSELRKEARALIDAMTPEEYYEQIEAADTEARKKKIQIALRYADENNTVEKGDVITDHRGSICVKIINLNHGFFLPEFIFSGESIESGEYRTILQQNIKHIEKAEVEK